MDESESKATKQADVIMLEDDLVVINDTKYRLIENHDNGFNKDKIEERYNSILDKYDYIVGDWGYDQLRFKGFYMDKRIESNLDNKISHLQDYLLEYCNFGCAYFILERVDKLPLTKPKHHKQRSRSARNNHRNNKNKHNNYHKNHKNTNSSDNHNNHSNNNNHSKNNSHKKNEGAKAQPHIRKRRPLNSKKTTTGNRHHPNKQSNNNKGNSKSSNNRTFKIRKIDK